MTSPLASHTTPSTQAGPAPKRRRSRAKPKPPRARMVVVTELRGLGGLVLEQALLDATAQPQTSLVSWANRLAMELDVPGAGRPPTYRDLMNGLVEINRRASADPARPMVAIPPATAAA